MTFLRTTYAYFKYVLMVALSITIQACQRKLHGSKYSQENSRCGQIYELPKSLLTISRSLRNTSCFITHAKKIATILRHLWLVKTGELSRAKGQLKEAGREAWDRIFQSLGQI